MTPEEKLELEKWKRYQTKTSERSNTQSAKINDVINRQQEVLKKQKEEHSKEYQVEKKKFEQY